MTVETPIRTYGWRVYGLGVMALAGVALAWGGFDPGQPVPPTFPGYRVLAWAAAGFMLAAGAAIQWRRATAWAAGALAAYYTLIVVVLLDGRVILRHAREFIAYSNTADQLAIAAGALLVFAAGARIDAAAAARLTRVGQMTFGVCAVLFGGAHFFYMSLTAPLVPGWLPPGQLFWGYATGVFHIAAGLAIITRIQARLAAVLLTVMYALFTALVHLPMLLGDPSNHGIWAENAANLALIGAAWVTADSLSRRSG